VGETSKDIKEILDGALGKATAQERAAYLDAACGINTPLRSEVESLLEMQPQVGDFLEVSPLDASVTWDASPLSEGPGTVVGRYKLLEKIGEGGMAVVYMAEQAKPIHRKVALKIIKLGMDTKSVIARFEAERQALALMDHPNIAKVLDAGATETGRPYFVMELVAGVSITEYCDKNNLSTKDRLALFVQVCNAVQHAHQKGIIHRDIKPSNVMVTMHDGVPVPKVIDFGIAKATNQKLTEKTLFTRYAHLIGTPAYMSPEQAELSDLDIDTRSDIYSLGVLLYELLTGTTPFSDEELRKAGYIEMQRVIREQEPAKPSTKLSTLGDTLTDIAKHRGCTPDLLRKAVCGDLDWIVMKTLEKDRVQRYETANGLAEDVRRHLGDEPVAAHPPSTLHRMNKFVRRHRGLVAAAATVIVVLSAGIVASTVFALRAEREAKISKAVSAFLNEDLLAAVDPEKAKAPEVTVRYILDAASENLEGKFKGSPLAEATVRQTLGETYQKLGEYKTAESHLARARQIRQEKLGNQHIDTLASMNSLARVYCYEGRYDEAEQLQTETLEIQRRVLGEEHPDTLTSMHNLSAVYCAQARYDQAEQLIIKTLEIRCRILGEEHPDTLASMNGLAVVYKAQGRWDEAEQLHVEVLEIRRRVLGEEHPDTLGSIKKLANVYLAQARYDEAEQLYIKVLEIQRRVLGEEHPSTLLSMNNLAVLYRDQAHYDEAKQLQSKVLEIQRRVLGEEHPATLGSINNLANVYLAQGRSDEAEQLYIKVLEIRRRVLGEEHPDTLGSMHNLAVLYKDQGHYDEAEQLYVKVLETQRQVLGEEHRETLGSMHDLAWLYRLQSRYEEAEQLLTETLEIRRRVLGEEHPDTLGSMINLANVYKAQGRRDEAEQLRVKTLENSRRVLGEEHPDTLIAMNNLANMYQAQGRWDEAEQLHSKVLEIRRRVLGEEHPRTLNSMKNLAVVYTHQGRHEEAELLLVKALEMHRRVLGEEHPDTLKCMHGLARVYRARDRYYEAEQLYVKTLEIQRRVLGEEHPDTLGSMNNLAWLKATCPSPQVRNGIEALAYATKACELTDWKDANHLDTLAAAYAEAGDFDSAVKWQREAIDLLPEDTPAKSRAGFESRLKRYQAGKPLAARQERAGEADGQTNEKEIRAQEEK